MNVSKVSPAEPLSVPVAGAGSGPSGSQAAVRGRPVAVRPGSEGTRLAKSSVNVMSVAGVGEFGESSSVNSRVTVPPGATGSSVKALVKEGAAMTVRVSLAGRPVRVAPSTVAVTSSVVLV